MRKLFGLLGETLRNGEAAVLVTVVASSGSTPRGVGACMLITARGRLRGTIGGGAVEYQSELLAQNILRTKHSATQYYQLRKNQVEDLGMICGGDVHVYFRYIPTGDEEILALTGRVEELCQRGEPSWLISEVATKRNATIGVYGKESGLMGSGIPATLIDKLSNSAVQVEMDGRTFYCERLVGAGVVYIFGGGHVAQALVPVLSAVEFRCVVLEDREEFCQKELFPGVEETRLIDNERILESVSISADDYVVVMTRGHKHDQTVQAQALKTPARYIGVIGSRRKSAGVFANLREMGFSDEDLGRITTPVGLAIKAETPAEIAVSIAAQLILKRAEG